MSWQKNIIIIEIYKITDIPICRLKEDLFCHISGNIKQGYHSILHNAYSYLPMNISGRVL